jgi:hypothetical protein
MPDEQGLKIARILVDVMCGGIAVTIATSAGVANERLGRHPISSPGDNSAVARQRGHGAAKIDAVAILAVGAALWPPLFDLTAGFKRLADRPALWLAFLWPIITITFDLAIGSQSTIYQQVMHPLQRPGNSPWEANTVLAVALAVGTIFTTKDSTGVDRQKVALPILMAGVALTLAFVLPVPTVDPSSDIGILIRTTQKGVFFNYAVGMMLASILVAFRLRA